MTLEEEIFEHANPNIEQLKIYGFNQKEDDYYYEKLLYHGNFLAQIWVKHNGRVYGKLIDQAFQEEFLNFRMKDIEGSFLNTIKEIYIALLIDIRDRCFYVPKKVNYWVVPANPKYYDVIDHFLKFDTITWKQTRDIALGDMVYIYIGSPCSAILFQCEAIKVNQIQDGRNTMELKLLQQYDPQKYPLHRLRKADLTSIRCTRILPQKTIAFLTQEQT